MPQAAYTMQKYCKLLLNLICDFCFKRYLATSIFNFVKTYSTYSYRVLLAYNKDALEAYSQPIIVAQT